MLGIALVALPGWLVVVGAALSVWLYGRTTWSSVPFGAGAFAAVMIFKLGDALLGEEPPHQQGRVPWFSGIASEIRLSRAQLRRRAQVAGLPESAVIAVGWAPCWAMLVFWGFLVVNATVQFVWG